MFYLAIPASARPKQSSVPNPIFKKDIVEDK